MQEDPGYKFHKMWSEMLQGKYVWCEEIGGCSEGGKVKIAKVQVLAGVLDSVRWRSTKSDTFSVAIPVGSLVTVCTRDICFQIINTCWISVESGSILSIDDHLTANTCPRCSFSITHQHCVCVCVCTKDWLSTCWIHTISLQMNHRPKRLVT